MTQRLNLKMNANPNDLTPWDDDSNEGHDAANPTPQSQNAPVLNADQQAAVDSLTQFLSDPDPSNWCFILAGYAGTGKTFSMRTVVERFSNSRLTFAFTAPTNKAAKVLKQMTGNACTIYSLLGLRIDKSGELKQLIAGKKTDLSGINVIVIDEGSMVNNHLFRILESECKRFDVKCVFMGDPAQLPPVGEPASPIWDQPASVTLTRVMRHDNQILDLVTDIRTQYQSLTPSLKLESKHSADEGVWKMTKDAFKRAIFDAAARGDFADGTTAKVVAWRNVRVAEYNQLIRAAIFGAAAVPGFYLPGDRIVAAGPCERGEEFLMSTDDEGMVESVQECRHPLEPKYMGLELKVRKEDNKLVRLLVIHPASATAFENDAQTIAHDARANPKLWKKFWNHKELFHDVKYGYALTAHRAQGSTYGEVYVDYQDILYNRNRREAFQCLYVACSRPTTKLFMA